MDFAPAPATANPAPKSDDKYAQKSVQLVRVSSFRSDLLHNPYFKGIFERELNYEFRVHLEMCKFNFRKASVQLWTANAQGRFIFNCLLCRKLSVLGAH